MTSFPGSPRTLRGGLVQIDPDTSQIVGIVTMQYNPDSLTRSLQMQATGPGTDRLEVLRLKGPPIETIKLDAEIDAADQLEFATPGSLVAQKGLLPQLAALETLLYPTSRQLLSNNSMANAGTLEIAPMEAPLTLFVWSKTRILPVRITDFSVTEEAFDVNLNPIRARVSLGMRVLSVSDLGFEHKGGNLFMVYQQGLEALAAQAQGTLGALGIGGI